MANELTKILEAVLEYPKDYYALINGNYIDDYLPKKTNRPAPVLRFGRWQAIYRF